MMDGKWDADSQHHGGHLAQGGEPTSALGHAGHGHQRHAVHDPHSRAMAASTHLPPSRRRFVDAWEFSTFKKAVSMQRLRLAARHAAADAVLGEEK